MNEPRVALVGARWIERRSRRAAFWTIGLGHLVDRQAKGLRHDRLCAQGDDAHSWLATL